MLFKKIIKRRSRSGGLVLFFNLPLTLFSEFGIKRKPIAKITPFFVGGLFGIWFGTITAGTRQIKFTVAAGTEILSAGTAHTPSDGVAICYRFSAIPAHCYMIHARCQLDQSGRLDYHYSMFTLRPCAAACGRAAISGSHLCAVHAASAEEEARRIGAFILEQQEIKDLNAPGLNFISTDFSNRTFYGCNFMGSVFSMCLFTGVVMRMCFFDSAAFEDCDFSGGDIQFVSFAGSTIVNCTFENSELIHLNYSGATIVESTFNDSNLYNSRFINADIKDSDFIDCNVKKVFFIRARQDGVSFKSSNTAETVQTQEEM